MKTIEEYQMDVDSIQKEFNLEITDAKTIEELDAIKIKYLSKKSDISAMMKEMRHVEDKQSFGNMINLAKTSMEDSYADKRKVFEVARLEQKLMESSIDVTLPSRENRIGKQNIILKTCRDLEEIFLKMGYEIAIGKEVETDFYNFEALNLSIDHPARDMQDTFYINPKLLLRTHTSNAQSRTLSQNPNQNIKIICPGKVYRRDDDDATHSHQFMQIEGLVVVKKEEGVHASLKELKTTLSMMANNIFNRDDINIRMRPSYFPFTEPSVEVDISCTRCNGKGCNFCKNTGWIEILGAGIINKKVLEHAGYDSSLYSGYAFGVGVERIALLKHQIEDIRMIYTNDYRFIDQF